MVRIVKPNYGLHSAQALHADLGSVLGNFKVCKQSYDSALNHDVEYRTLRRNCSERRLELERFVRSKVKTDAVKARIAELRPRVKEMEEEIEVYERTHFHDEYFTTLHAALLAFWVEAVQAVLPPVLERGMGFSEAARPSSSARMALPRPSSSSVSHARPAFTERLSVERPSFLERPSVDRPSYVERPSSVDRASSLAGPSSLARPFSVERSSYEAQRPELPAFHSLRTESPPALPSMMQVLANAVGLGTAPRPMQHNHSARFLQAFAQNTLGMEPYLSPDPDAMQAKHAYMLLLLRTFVFSDANTAAGAGQLSELLEKPVIQQFLNTKCRNGPVTPANMAVYRVVTMALWVDYNKLAESLRAQGVRVLSPANLDDDDD
jgi:hypothetical protein